MYSVVQWAPGTIRAVITFNITGDVKKQMNNYLNFPCYLEQCVYCVSQ